VFKVDKDVEMPDKNSGRPKVYPFGDMCEGDSFFVPADKGRPTIKQQIASAASVFGLRNNIKFSIRTVEGGYRVWRVAIED